MCPVCSVHWKEIPLLAVDNNNNSNKKNLNQNQNQKSGLEEDDKNKRREKESSMDVKTKDYNKNLKVYNDDEPLMSPTAGSGFIPIPESDETEDENGEDISSVAEFQGFFVDTTPALSSSRVSNAAVFSTRNIDVKLLPEAAVVSVGQSYETYAVVLKVKAPPVMAASDDKTSSLLPNPANRAPIDLVTVIDVSGRMNGEKQQSMKRAMKLVISSLSSKDRLSIVAFSANSKRLLPLKRMTPNGRRSARRIVDALGSIGRDACAGDALKKAAKVLEDRLERNPVASIMLLADGSDDRISTISSTRFAHLNIPVHAFGFNETNAPADDAFAKFFGTILSVAVQDLRLELGFISGSAPAQIAAIYSCTGQPTIVGPGSIRFGDLYDEEERELLIELKVPSSAIGSHHVLSVRSSFKDPSSRQLIFSKEQALLVPRPHAVRSSSPSIGRLRNLFVTTRAVAESRRLIERNDLTGAHHLLYSTRALLIQSGSASSDEYLRGLESELAELNWRRQQQVQQIQRQRAVVKEGNIYVDEKGEPLTPTSAWRAAERLAKVAIMRKSLNRVSDLHGFENARF